MIKTVYLLPDPELGEVLFRKNTNAKSYIIRIKNDQVKVTIPLRGNFQYAHHFFLQNRNQILIRAQQQKEKIKEREDISFSIEELNRLIDSANRILPDKLFRLAQKHGFKYRICKIGKSRSSWGSCSSKGTIILSCYLMILPENLIDYVIFHELCHTIQANHSPAFWDLLDQYTDGKAKTLRKELRNFPIK